MKNSNFTEFYRSEKYFMNYFYSFETPIRYTMHQNLWGHQFGKESLGMLLFFVN